MVPDLTQTPHQPQQSYWATTSSTSYTVTLYITEPDLTACSGSWLPYSAPVEDPQPRPGYRALPGTKQISIPVAPVLRAAQPAQPIRAVRRVAAMPVRQPPSYHTPRRWRSRVITHGMRTPR